MNMQKTSSLALVCAAFLAPAAHAANGSVVSGAATWVVNGADSAIVRSGTVIKPGNLVRSEADGYATWVMADDAEFEMGGTSEVSITSYQFAKEPGVVGGKGKGEVQINLVSGGVRHVVGRIAETNPVGFLMTTPNGKISLPKDNADFSVVYCNQSCGNDAEGKPIPDGLYVAVNEGGVTVSNSPGLAASAGQYVFVAPGGHPVLLGAPPAVFKKGKIVGANDQIGLGLGLSIRIEPQLPASPTLP